MKKCENCGSINYNFKNNSYECLKCGQIWMIIEGKQLVLKNGLSILCESENNENVYGVF